MLWGDLKGLDEGDAEKYYEYREVCELNFFHGWDWRGYCVIS